MNIKQFFHSFFLCNLMISSSYCWRPYSMKFTSVSSYSLVNYIETNSSVSRSSGSLSLFFSVLQDIPSLYSKSLITVDPSNGVYVELVNKTIDTCEFYRNPKYEPISQVFYRALIKDGIFPKRCPIRKKLYFLQDVVMDPESFPPVMPYRGVKAEITFFVKKGNEFKTICGHKLALKIN